MTIIFWQLRATPLGTLQLIDVNLAGVVVAVILMDCWLLCWWLGWRCIAIKVLILSSGEDTPVYFSKAVGSPCMSGICPSNRWNSYFQRTEKMVSLHGMHWGLKKSTIVSWKPFHNKCDVSLYTVPLCSDRWNSPPCNLDYSAINLLESYKNTHITEYQQLPIFKCSCSSKPCNLNWKYITRKLYFLSMHKKDKSKTWLLVVDEMFIWCMVHC